MLSTSYTITLPTDSCDELIYFLSSRKFHGIDCVTHNASVAHQALCWEVCNREVVRPYSGVLVASSFKIAPGVCTSGGFP